MGKVHGSLARAGKVKSQTPKVEPQEKKKTPKGRAKKRLTYTRRFVNVTMTGGKRKHGAKNVVTLFHAPSNQASTRVLTLLKQANAQSVAHATEDQASSHQSQNKAERTEFELDVTEAPPTTDQLKNILDYLGGPSAVGKVISGAENESDAMRRLKADGGAFQRPLVVDWNQGKAVAGENESEIMKLYCLRHHSAMAETSPPPGTSPAIEEPAVASADRTQPACPADTKEPVIDAVQHATRDPKFAPGARQAYFSTELGTRAPRSLSPATVPVIYKSEQIPCQCLCILPEQKWVAEDLWDTQDLHVEGREFCEEMLLFISRDTWYSANKFAKDWAQAHPDQFNFTGIQLGNVYDLNDPLTAVDKIFVFDELVDFPRVFLWHVAFIMIATWSDPSRTNNAAFGVGQAQNSATMRQQHRNSSVEATALDGKKLRKTNRKQRRSRPRKLTATTELLHAELSPNSAAVVAPTVPVLSNMQPTPQRAPPFMPQHPGAPMFPPRNSGMEGIGMGMPSMASPNMRAQAMNMLRGNRNIGPESYNQPQGWTENNNRMAHGSYTRQPSGPMAGIQSPQYMSSQPIGPHMAVPMMPGSAMGPYVQGSPLMPHPQYTIHPIDPTMASRGPIAYQPGMVQPSPVSQVFMRQPQGPHTTSMGDMTNIHLQGPMGSQIVDPRAPMTRRASHQNNSLLFDPYSGNKRKFSGGSGYNIAKKGGPSTFVPPPNRGRKTSSSGGRAAHNSYNPAIPPGSYYTNFNPRRRLPEDDPAVTGDAVSGCGHTWIGPKNTSVNELWIGDLPQDIHEDELVLLFQQAVKISPTGISLRSNSLKGPFHAFATFASCSDAKKALTITELNPRLRNGEVQPTISVPRRFYQKESPPTAHPDHTRAGEGAGSNPRGATGASHNEKNAALGASEGAATSSEMVLYSPQDARSGLPKKPPARPETVARTGTGSPGLEKPKREHKSPTKKGKGKNKRGSPVKKGDPADEVPESDETSKASGSPAAGSDTAATTQDGESGGSDDKNATDARSAEEQANSSMTDGRAVPQSPDKIHDTQVSTGSNAPETAQEEAESMTGNDPVFQSMDMKDHPTEKRPHNAETAPQAGSVTKAGQQNDAKSLQPLLKEHPPTPAYDNISDDEAKNDISFHSAPEVQPETTEVEPGAEVRNELTAANQGKTESLAIAAEPKPTTSQTHLTPSEQPAPASKAKAKAPSKKPTTEETHHLEDSVIKDLEQTKANPVEEGAGILASNEASPIEATKKGGAQQMQSLHPFATKSKAQTKKDKEARKKQQKKEEAERIAKAKADKANPPKNTKAVTNVQSNIQAPVNSSTPSAAVDTPCSSRQANPQAEENAPTGMKESKGNSKTHTTGPSTKENEKNDAGEKETGKPRGAFEKITPVTEKTDKPKIADGPPPKKDLSAKSGVQPGYKASPSLSPLASGTVPEEQAPSNDTPVQEVNSPRKASPGPAAHQTGFKTSSPVSPIPSSTNIRAPSANTPGSSQHNKQHQPISTPAPPPDMVEAPGPLQDTTAEANVPHSDNETAETPKKKKKRKNRKKKKATAATGSSTDGDENTPGFGPHASGEDLYHYDPFTSQLTHVEAIRRAVKYDTESYYARTSANIEKKKAERKAAGLSPKPYKQPENRAEGFQPHLSDRKPESGDEDDSKTNDEAGENKDPTRGRLDGHALR
ncbi:hypothetical protein TW65_08208 [Stemphylium lycopersici]|nr:hypothetical protein TW65_08208 [Stemphylium lycopersici]